MQLGELQEYFAQFRAAGVQIYAVSVDTPEHNARLKARLGAGYEFLADVRAELLDALDIRQPRRAPTGRDSALATQYLVDQSGSVRWFHRPQTWRVRPHPREALAALERAGLKSDPAAAAPPAGS